MEPPASAWWLKGHIEQAFASLEKVQVQEGWGWDSCPPAWWGGAGQTGTHVSPQQESSLCPADHSVLFLLCRRLGSRQDFKCIQCFPSLAAGLGSATQQQQPQVAQTKAGWD